MSAAIWGDLFVNFHNISHFILRLMEPLWPIMSVSVVAQRYFKCILLQRLISFAFACGLCHCCVWLDRFSCSPNRTTISNTTINDVGSLVYNYNPARVTKHPNRHIFFVCTHFFHYIPDGKYRKNEIALLIVEMACRILFCFVFLTTNLQDAHFFSFFFSLWKKRSQDVFIGPTS